MTPPAIAAAFMLALPGLATAQANLALAQMERAKELLAADQQEKAARILRRAWRLSENCRPPGSQVQRKLQKELGQLLRAADGKSKAVAQSQAKFARELYDKARDYTKKGWQETALELMRGCAALYPEVYAKATADLQEKVDALKTKDDPVTTNEILVKWFDPAVQPTKEQQWKVGEDGARSPTGVGDASGSTILLSGRELKGDARLRLQVKVPQKGRVAVCWDSRYEGATMSFHMAEMEHVEGGTHFDVHFVDDQEVKRLGNAWLKLDQSAQSQWLTLEIELRGRSVLASLGPMDKPIECTMERDSAGPIGFYVNGSTKSPDPVLFRHLSVEQYRQLD